MRFALPTISHHFHFHFFFSFRLLLCMWFCLFSDDKRTKQIRSVHWSLGDGVVANESAQKTLSHFIVMPFWLVFVCVCVAVSSVVWLTRDSYLFANAFNFTDNHLFFSLTLSTVCDSSSSSNCWKWELWLRVHWNRAIEPEMISVTSTPIAAGARGNGFRLEFKTYPPRRKKSFRYDWRFFWVFPRNT